MINLNSTFPSNSGSPTTDYPYGSARNVTTTGDNTGTPFVASLQNDIIGNQQYLLQEAGVVPNNTPDNATTSQQFEAMWKIFNMRTFTKNMTVNADYTLTARENLKTRIRITDTSPVLTTSRNIIVDTVPRLIIAHNATLQTLTFKTSSGTGIAVLAGTTKILYCDGTNVIQDSYDIQSASETVRGIIELATTAKAQSGTDDTSAITSLKLRNALNATGSAPIYACRAWVNFNGTGTIAIRASGNVSSIIDNGTADYTVNFLTAMPDANYSAVGIVQRNQTVNGDGNFASIKASSNYDSLLATSARVQSTDATGVLLDPLVYCVSIFR